LLATLAIVEVKELRGGFTVWTDDLFGDFFIGATTLDGFKSVAVGSLKFLKKLFPIQSWFVRFGRWLAGKGAKRVYIEVPVIGVFFLKSSFGFTSGLRLARMSCRS
jgi:hypothetical protein